MHIIIYPQLHSLTIYSLLSNFLLFLSLQKEHYLGLVIGNDNWWRTHGIDCRLETVGGGGSGAAAAGATDHEMAVVGSGATAAGAAGSINGGGGAGEEYTSCLISYTVIETIHAALFMFLTVSH
jgi:hypothetical protein